MKPSLKRFFLHNGAAQRGYTLVELIVAVGLFAFVMTIAAGSYLTMIGLNERTQGLVSGINNLSSALESMTRSIRTGYGYNCAGLGDCSSGASSLSFTNASGQAVTYTLGTQTGRNGTVGDITANGSPLTDPSVDITDLTFYVFGSSSADENQARITISVSGTVTVGPGKTEPFTIETGATMRGTDI